MTNKQILALSKKEDIKEELEKKYPGGIECIRKILNLVGDDPKREGLIDTPYRVVKSWLEMFSGYTEDLDDILSAVFKDDIGNQTDEIIMCKNITFHSMCEHHILPFSGVCHIGYLPGNKIIGLSKMARLVDYFSRRLQIQEKLTSQIANTLYSELGAGGVGVIIEAQHLCMTSRGAKNPTSVMRTSAMRGKFKSQPQTRNEFLQLIRI